ncbi:MAG: insulinase family protein [Candidatus Omnitrophica bacterium]|nr:insulinase family protein [Candidatus Omnitrophota bacterium]
MRTDPQRKRQAPYQLEALHNGAGLVLHEQPHARSVAVGLWVRAGGRYEAPEQAGISHFVEHLLFKGTRRRSCEALKQRVEGVGGSLNGFTAEEFTCFMAKVPCQHARGALDVLADMLLHSRFDARDVEKEREVILEEIRMYEDAPGQMVHDLFNQLLWPGHPLGTVLSGSLETVRRISREALIAYWRRMYQPRNLLVACVGAFERAPMQREIRRLVGALKGRAPSRFLRAPRAGRLPQVRVWQKPTEQTHLCVGTYAVPRTHPERFALELLHVILGANMSSRLFREVRERRGLAYEIGTSIKRLEDTGAFLISAGCDAGKVTQTVETIFHELSRVRRQPVSRAELRRAKDYYAGQLWMGLEDPMDHMLWMGEQAVTVGRVGRPELLLEHLERVTPADIRHVARGLFETSRMRVAVMGPVEEPDASRLRTLCRID